MPELPEVHTTVTGLRKVLVGLSMKSVWSDMWSTATLGKNTIKDKTYFPYFKKYALNQKVKDVRRRAKYILIDLENSFTIIIHMKMTGHLMYGVYKQNKKANGKEWAWVPIDDNEALLDPYNRHIHVVFTLSNDRHLAFCDSRKFGSITILKTSTIDSDRLAHLGPEPLEETFKEINFIERLQRFPNRPIKQTLMDQTVIAGIGNIYSDEMLHLSHIQPTRVTKSLKTVEKKLLFKAMKKVLGRGIDFGGDSMSDYRNIEGKRGKFQEKHLVYLRTNQKCKTKNCRGIIKKEKVGGRSAHYCPICQK
ncbi:MAG: formamidopyrimidine-DNA glycosylase, formamidopyrimidine-DNA glycosylase [Candidatus Nomurabacteria bacterium]|nr:formamidopyrimidine-DNA glycosylase, formamidopyrimidine-DNA glycosylase [Candidatus Nomurabacteria bacterium]